MRRLFCSFLLAALLAPSLALAQAGQNKVVDPSTYAPTYPNGFRAAPELIDITSGGILFKPVPTGTWGGATPFKLIAANTTNATSLKASAGQIYSISIVNAAAALRYVKFYNKASAPTVGTDTPVYVIGLAATSSVQLAIDPGLTFTTGIAFATTTGIADSDATAVAANDLAISIGYK